MSGRYYPNKWQLIKNAPVEFFDTLSFAEFIDWKFNSGLELLPGYSCIIRAEHIQTGKVTEHVYKQQSSAEKRILKYGLDATHDLIFATTDLIVFIPAEALYDPRTD